MDLDETIRTTFAAREFTDDPLPDDVLWEILDTARFAPSGGNRQGAHIVVVRDPDTRRALAELSKPGARRYLAQRELGENPWNATTDSAVTPEMLESVDGVDDFVEPVAAAPVTLVVSVDLGKVAALDQYLDRVGIVGGASIYPLVWNILLATRAAGFGGTITSMAVAEEPQLRALLGLPATHAVAAVLPLGRPVRQLTKLSRRPVDEFVTRDRYDGVAFSNQAG